MIVVLDKNEKEIIKKIIEENEEALKIVDSINEREKEIDKKYSCWTTLGCFAWLLPFLFTLAICIYPNIYSDLLFYAIFLVCIIIILISVIKMDSIHKNGYKLSITKKNLNYLNLVLKEKAVEKKYSVKRQSDERIWYLKNGELMNVEYKGKNKILYVVYWEYYVINNGFLSKKNKFNHFENMID